MSPRHTSQHAACLLSALGALTLGPSFAHAQPSADAGAQDGASTDALASAHADLVARASSGDPPVDPNALLWRFWGDAHDAALAHHERGDAAAAAAAAALAFVDPPLHDPATDPAPDGYARLCLHDAKGDPCVPHLDVRLVPSSALVLTDLGYLLQRGGEHDAAADLLTKTCSMFPEHMPAWTNLGDALVSQGKVPEAYVAYQRYLNLRAAKGLPSLDVRTLATRALERAGGPPKPARVEPQKTSCGCATPTAPHTPSPLWLVALGALAITRRQTRPRSA